MPQAGVDVLQFTVDEVETLDGGQLVLQAGQPEMGAWCDEGVDLGRREVLQQARHVVVHAVR